MTILKIILVQLDNIDISLLTISIAAITPIVAAIVYSVQNTARKDSFFKDCAKSLYSSNYVEQTTSAILLRDFIKKRKYASKTKNIMVALLRTSVPLSLQKTIADVFSYAQSLEGQDMQYINMLDAVIKPQSRIKFELTGDKKYNDERLSMRQADFYHAILQECNFNNVNATKAVFFCANLGGANFHNCIFKEANFKCAYMNGAKFDKDCELIKACFENAVGLSEAMVVNKGDGMEHPLIFFLDENGVFTHYQEDIRYKPKNKSHKIFVSKLGAMDSQQKMHYDNVLKVVSDFEDTKLDVIERENYPLVSQLSDVKAHMEGCDGCVIFAFEYMRVEAGFIHKNIIGDDHKEIDSAILASPWLQIEAAIANSKRMPCLIVYDKGLLREGMFDTKLVDPDKNLFSVEYSDYIQTNNMVVKEWMSKVREYHYLKEKNGKY